MFFYVIKSIQMRSIKHVERILLFLLVFLIPQSETANTDPEQIHLSFGENCQEIVVTWVTFSPTENSFVWFSSLSEEMTYKTEGYMTTFVDEGQYRTTRYIHRAILQDLKPLNYYMYQCGSSEGVSDPYVFKVTPTGTNWSPRLIIFGDMGLEGAAAFPYIINETSDYDVDAIVHVGDIAYNMDFYEGCLGDEFMEMIQPVASSIPYMTIPGNHEQAYNFSHYKNRFSMPGDSEGLYYSFNLGPVHFIGISTEVYYFTKYGCSQLINQYKWLLDDLQEASKIENRHHRPWIIVFQHRPLYCSSDSNEDCTWDVNILKSCDYGLEPIFHKYNVDLIFAGHMHYYERSWPLYKNKVYNGSFDNPYLNPRATVHIITGAAGMSCGTETASYIRNDWFGFFSCEYSYTILTVHNRTHILLEQVSANRGGEVFDRIWFIKDPLRAY